MGYPASPRGAQSRPTRCMLEPEGAYSRASMEGRYGNDVLCASLDVAIAPVLEPSVTGVTLQVCLRATENEPTIVEWAGRSPRPDRRSVEAPRGRGAVPALSARATSQPSPLEGLRQKAVASSVGPTYVE